MQIQRWRMTEYEIGEPVLAWWMPQIEERGPVVSLSGVIRPGSWPPAEDLKLAIDGKIASAVDYMRRADAGAIHFRAMLPVPSTFAAGNEIVLRVTGAGSQRCIRDWDQFHLERPGRKSAIPLPPENLTQRAIWMSPRTFDKWGYALKRKYDEAVASFLPRRGEKQRLLDWGCGAGRLARYLAGECDYHGIDIDREAIAWCQKNIPDGSFTLQSLEARTAFAADSFDAAIGISIFTHLKEEEQFAWLAELARITRANGVVSVSVNCATSLFNADNPPAVRDILRSRGFCDTGVEPSHRGVTDDDSYYRNIYHTHGYIREKWSQWFDVLAILPGFVGNMQDMVFLRPRK
jgi:SAM-dependent methyltransferase